MGALSCSYGEECDFRLQRESAGSLCKRQGFLRRGVQVHLDSKGHGGEVRDILFNILPAGSSWFPGGAFVILWCCENVMNRANLSFVCQMQADRAHHVARLRQDADVRLPDGVRAQPVARRRQQEAASRHVPQLRRAGRTEAHRRPLLHERRAEGELSVAVQTRWVRKQHAYSFLCPGFNRRASGILTCSVTGTL